MYGTNSRKDETKKFHETGGSALLRKKDNDYTFPYCKVTTYKTFINKHLIQSKMDNNSLDDEGFYLEETPAVRDKKTALTSGILAIDTASASDPAQPGNVSFAGYPVSEARIYEHEAHFTIQGIGRGQIPSPVCVVDCQEIRFTAEHAFSDETRRLFEKATSSLSKAGFRYHAQYSAVASIDFWIGTPFEERSREETAQVVLDNIVLMLEQDYRFDNTERNENCLTLKTVSTRETNSTRSAGEGIKTKDDTETTEKGSITIQLYNYNPHGFNCDVYVTGEGDFDKTQFVEIQNRIARYLQDNYMHVIQQKVGGTTIGSVSVREPKSGFVIHVYNKATEIIKMYQTETAIYAHLVENIHLLRSIGINDVNDLGAKIIKEGIEQMRLSGIEGRSSITDRTCGEIKQDLIDLIKEGKETEYTRTLYSILRTSINIPGAKSELSITLHGKDLFEYEQFLMNWRGFEFKNVEEMKSRIITCGIRPILDVLCQLRSAANNPHPEGNGYN